MHIEGLVSSPAHMGGRMPFFYWIDDELAPDNIWQACVRISQDAQQMESSASFVELLIQGQPLFVYVVKLPPMDNVLLYISTSQKKLIERFDINLHKHHHRH